MLVGIDGSKALRKAVIDVLDHPVIQRCQLTRSELTGPRGQGQEDRSVERSRCSR